MDSTFGSSVMIGLFIGFAFGVGCALAVLYAIYLGGYRAAVRDSRLPVAPERLVKALGKLEREKPMPLEPEG